MGFYGTVFGAWGIVALYAFLHDQYLVRISPEHFTVYHPNPLEIENAHLLAAYLAFVASISPGFVLGVSLYLVGRFGRAPRIPVKRLLQSVCILVGITEIMSLLSLGFAALTRSKLYPSWLYPVDDYSLVCSQTVQLTAYFVGFVGSGVLLWITRRKRFEMKA